MAQGVGVVGVVLRTHVLYDLLSMRTGFLTPYGSYLCNHRQ